MTRWTLIFALLLIGSAIFWRESSKQIEGYDTGFSQFLSDYTLAILLGTFIFLNVLLLSLKLITERKGTDIIREWTKQTLLISSVVIYPLMQTVFDFNSPAISFILITLLIIPNAPFIMLYPYLDFFRK